MKDVLKQSMGTIFGKRYDYKNWQMILFYGSLIVLTLVVFV